MIQSKHTNSASALVQSLTSTIHGRVTSWPWERACVDALVFMFWRLAMMKESLFKSGLAGPPLNAPPFSPYNCMHALPISYARTYKRVKACSQKKLYTCRDICKFCLQCMQVGLYGQNSLTSLQYYGLCIIDGAPNHFKSNYFKNY